MTKLWLLGLAASAALVPMAAAQAAQTVPDPDPFYGLPAVSLKTSGAPVRAAAAQRQAPKPAPVVAQAAPAPAGVTWHEPARVVRHVRTPAPVVRTPAPIVRDLPMDRIQVRDMPQMAGHGPAREVHNVVVRRGAPPAGLRRELRRVSGDRLSGGGHFEMRRRIDRGGFIPPMWMGPQFMISNWGMYGFPQPMSGRRWIRYYDDALLIDRNGRVIDGRYGMDWDRYGDRWHDRDGVPVYAGDYDDYDDRYDRDDRDEDWEDRDDRDGGDYRDHSRRDERVVYRHAQPGGHACGASMCGAPPPPPAYGYGYTYGGCGCGPVVITETVTTTAPVVESRTYYEYVKERAPAPRRYRAPARRPAPPPPPPPPYHDGERG
jgi:Ni/Co efflux regulator RcnB